MERMTMRANHSGSGAAASAWKARTAVLLVAVILAFTTCTLGDLPLRDALVELGYRWVQTSKVEADTPVSTDQFGRSVAVYGDWAAIGDNEDNSSRGAVYIYHKSSSGWAFSQKIAGGAADDFLGTSVALYGEYLLIGAPGVSSDSGRAYVYFLSSGTWALLRTLQSPVVDGAGLFGMSAALTAEYAFVGAPYHGAGEGRVYAFYKNELGADMWGAPSNGQTLQRSAPRTMGDYFGSAVAASGDYAVIGVPESGLGTPSGGASIFHLSVGTWTQTAVLVSDNPSFDYFGTSVSISGDVAVVGAPDEEAVYAYARSGSSWNSSLLTVPDAYAGSEFGTSVAVSGPLLIVGAPADDNLGDDAGSACFYRLDSEGWKWDRAITAADGAEGAQFGSAAALSGNDALIAAIGKAQFSTHLSGAAYFLERVR